MPFPGRLKVLIEYPKEINKGNTPFKICTEDDEWLYQEHPEEIFYISFYYMCTVIESLPSAQIVPFLFYFIPTKSGCLELYPELFGLLKNSCCNLTGNKCTIGIKYIQIFKCYFFFTNAVAVYFSPNF